MGSDPPTPRLRNSGRCTRADAAVWDLVGGRKWMSEAEELFTSPEKLPLVPRLSWTAVRPSLALRRETQNQLRRIELFLRTGTGVYQLKYLRKRRNQMGGQRARSLAATHGRIWTLSHFFPFVVSPTSPSEASRNPNYAQPAVSSTNISMLMHVFKRCSN